MSLRALSVCLVWVLLTTLAEAAPSTQEQAKQLAEAGNELGRQGQLAEALEKFREAHALAPRPLFACNIGLAYVRQGEWQGAHYYLGLCERGWTGKEEGPLPAWVSSRLVESAAKLRAAGYVPLRVSATPITAQVRVQGAAVAAFSSGEKVWLSPGTQSFTLSAPGHVTHEWLADVQGDTELRFAWRLQPEVPQPEVAASQSASSHDATNGQQKGPSAARFPFEVVGIGSVLLVSAAFGHYLALQALDEAEALELNSDAYSDKSKDYRRKRNVTYGLYGVSAATLSIGLYLALRGTPKAKAPVTLHASRDGATLWLQGSW